jgi:hypothetical protein
VDGMWNLRGRFDPLTGIQLDARLGESLEALFATSTPDTCPTDPLAKQDHLRALALAELILAGGSAPKPGRPEFLIVVDADAPATAGPSTEFSIPVEIPWRVLADLAADADIHTVVVRNGVVLHAAGNLDLGRTTRLANRAQRRALRGLYATCAIPGCGEHYDRCKLHHIIWWRHGGRTDLDNLLPVCVRHHHKIHDAGWTIDLGPNRQLTIRYPDGTIHTTGPPTIRAA